jgi:hypothetical protein
MKNYRQANSVALYNACLTISNTKDNDSYPLASGESPGSFKIPGSDISNLKSEMTKRKRSFPSSRRQGGAIHLKKSLASYNATLDDDTKVKKILIRIDAPQLLSIKIIEEHRKNGEVNNITNEVTYCGFFSIEWSTPEPNI